MHSALVAAFVLGNLPVYLYPQSALPDANWPTHATIAVPQGWVGPQHKTYLTENGRPMLAQVEVASRWPDGSPKWIHAFGQFRYSGGKPARYEFVSAKELPAEMPASPLRVRDGVDGIQVESGELTVLVPRPFVGISLLKRGDKTLIRGDGGPYVIDGEGTQWHARHDRAAEVTVEQQGPAQVTIKATGFYQTLEARKDTFCRFSTRFTIVAGSPIIKIDHATTFADDMKRHQIAELGFKFALPGATAFNSPTHRGRFHDKLHAAYLAQLTADRLYRVAQTGPDAERDIRHQGDFERSVGWFSTTVGDQRLALLAKDFWQKYPKEVKFSPEELVFYQWPRHGELSVPEPDATAIHNVYKFKCFHSGDKLDSRLPEEYFQSLSNQSDTTECKAEFARDGNLQGASMRNEFALVVADDGDPKSVDEHLERLHQLYLLNPTARVSPQALADSGALGPVAPASEPLAETERVVVDGLLGYARSISRYGDYGWGIYGNVHSLEMLNYSVDGRRVGRPSLHRVWINSHYQHVTATWQAWGLNGDQRLLQLARVYTDNYGSIGQIRYDKAINEGDPNEPKRRASVRYHWPGGFYHCKALLPWGSRSYEDDAMDTDAALWGHWPDPSALLSAWLYDADRWAKDGYDIWRSQVRLSRTGTRREMNQTLVQAMNLYDYEPTDELLSDIKGLLFGIEQPGKGLVSGLLSQPLQLQEPGPLWSPVWLTRAYHLFPNDQRLREYIVKSANETNLSITGIWTLALSATAWEITRDPKYLERHAGSMATIRQMIVRDPTGWWEGYGLAPGATGDNWFAVQWYHFVKAWRDAKLGSPIAPKEPGTYLCPSSNVERPADVAARGGRILILQDKAGAARPAPLNIQVANILSGDMHVTSFSLISPDGRPLWSEPKIDPGKRGERPSGRGALTKEYPGPGAAGLNTLLFGSYSIGIYQGLAGGLPECQLLQSTHSGGPDNRVVYMAQVSSGWLVPTTENSTRLSVTAAGTFGASWISITPRNGTRQLRWLIPGDTVQSLLESSAGPWLLELGGALNGNVRVEIESNVPSPLLYGSNLEHIQMIKQALNL